MEKRVLILVLSSDFEPYSRMIATSQNTWDSVEVPGVETIFYSSESEKQNTDKIIYLPVDDDLYNVGRKTLMAFEWALKYRDREFDYIARANASTYVNKKELIKYVQPLPKENVFEGVGVANEEGIAKWVWGGGSFLISKDVLHKIVINQHWWDHGEMEDKAMSYVIARLGIPFRDGRACSINKKNDKWMCLCYGTNSYDFTYFSEIKKDDGQFFFRCKQDGQREMEEMIMNELFKNLK